MIAIRKAVYATAVLAIGLVVLANVSRAQTPPTPDALLKALAEAGKPGPEHKKLQPFVGNWTFTMKVWTDPAQPPAELRGTIARNWIMDGRFVQETLRGECAKTGASFEGLGLLGYNAGEKKFSCVKACGLCGTVSAGLVSCDSTGRFECVKEECCPVTGQKVKGRDEVIIESPDRIVFNMYKTIEGREVRVMEMVSLRRK